MKLSRNLVMLSMAVVSCGGTSTNPATPIVRNVERAEWRYEVTVGQGARNLVVEMSIPQGPARRLSVEPGTEPFIENVVMVTNDNGVHLDSAGTSWMTHACPTGCRLRYQVRLADAGSALDDVSLAKEHNGVFLSPPSTWLLRPRSAGDAKVKLRIKTPADIQFVTGLFRSPEESDMYEATLDDLDVSPYSAFGPLKIQRIASVEGTIQVGIIPGFTEVSEASVMNWVTDAARNVAQYYGRFPVPHALVLLMPEGRAGPGFASALGNGGASIVARVGTRSTPEDLEDAWQMTHEMLHLAFPNLARRHSWLEEGMATYVEPIARARLGRIPAAAVWRDLALGLPKGLPMPGDRGLDYTPTWGRRYWGGALFCLLADIRIREQTQNARSLDDALRAILAAGGNISVRWDIERTLEEGDKATGVRVLMTLYEEMKGTPINVDLDGLWTQLGVSFQRGKIHYDNDAPLARIRQSIVEPRDGGQRAL